MEDRPRTLVNVTEDSRVTYWLGVVTTETILLTAGLVEFNRDADDDESAQHTTRSRP